MSRDRLITGSVHSILCSLHESSTGEVFDYYEITTRPLTQQIYPNLQATNFIGYNGLVPGPTIRTTIGKRSVVRFINRGTRPLSVHLHGSPSRPVFNGWAEDLIEVSQYKDYVYPNHSPRMLWYHDHAIHITAINAFYGQAAAYIVYDPVQEAALGLPQGNYDIPMILTDRIYQSNGQLVSPQGEDTSYYGDIIHVNGVPWPYFNAEPRKYRFRILNTSLSRSYKIRFVAVNGASIPFQVIATDSGYIEHPVTASTIISGIAERYEVVVDLSAYADQTIHVRNARDFSQNEDFARTDYVMQIIDDLVNLNFPTDTGALTHRQFQFARTNSEWRIDDIGFADVKNRILAKPIPGSTEIWKLENPSGGWAHPIHIHLVDFKVISRNGRGVEPYEAGFKNVVFLDENEIAEVIARFHPWRGQYMFHCHNLVHEDGDMMAAFDVGDTKARPENGDSFSDPLDAKFRPKPHTGPTNITNVEAEVLPFIASLDIYPLDQCTLVRTYWLGKKANC
ncbi:Cupredoxin [Terfezia claveryi]|nr:Cupredoxin [Terfezia claveryi]